MPPFVFFALFFWLELIELTLFVIVVLLGKKFIIQLQFSDPKFNMTF